MTIAELLRELGPAAYIDAGYTRLVVGKDEYQVWHRRKQQHYSRLLGSFSNTPEGEDAACRCLLEAVTARMHELTQEILKSD